MEESRRLVEVSGRWVKDEWRLLLVGGGDRKVGDVNGR